MKHKLENFELFMCDKCGEIVLVNDVHSLNKVTSHYIRCSFNKKIMEDYNNELKACKYEIELELVHKKYIKLL